MPAREVAPEGRAVGRWSAHKPPQDGAVAELKARREGQRRPGGFCKNRPSLRRLSDVSTSEVPEGLRVSNSKKLLTHAKTLGFRAIQGMQNHEIRLRNDLSALKFIYLFGWLRVISLGTLMKPHTATSLEAGSRLARSLINRQLVLARRLPEGAGQALVLATAGVRLLAEQGIHAVTGKSIGQTVGKEWIPSTSWKHDALAQSVLCELFKLGYVVIPEAEIRRRAGILAKLPDGLARSPDGTWLWLEVENARKSGPHMRRLADAIAAVSEAQIEVCGVRPSRSLIAYWEHCQDERGYRVNHRERITKAIAAQARNDIQLTFAECTRKGCAGISNIVFSETTVPADHTSAVLKCLNASGWYSDEKSGVCKANYGNYTAYVWQDSDAPGTWSYDAGCNGEGSGQAGYVGSISEAKRRAAELIAHR